MSRRRRLERERQAEQARTERQRSTVAALVARVHGGEHGQAHEPEPTAELAAFPVEEPAAPEPAPAAPPAAPVLDLDAITARVREQLAAEQAEAAAAEREAEAARLDAAAHGGPCRYCGCTLLSPAAGRPGKWIQDMRGTSCSACDVDRRQFGDPEGVGLPDSEHRERVVRRLLGREVVQWHAHGTVAGLVAFQWFAETHGAAPGEAARFAYLDVPALLRALEPPAPPPLAVREPCARCGVAHLWAERHEREHDIHAWECTGCLRVQITPLDEVAAMFVGVKPFIVGKGFAELLGVCFWRDRPESERGEPAATPFDWWDRAAMRRTALRLYPDEGSWSARRPWDRARELAGKRPGEP